MNSSKVRDLVTVALAAAAGAIMADLLASLPHPALVILSPLRYLSWALVGACVFAGCRLRGLRAAGLTAALSVSFLPLVQWLVAMGLWGLGAFPYSRQSWWLIWGISAMASAMLGRVVASWVDGRWPALSSRAQTSGFRWFLAWALVTVVIGLLILTMIGILALPLAVFVAWRSVGRRARFNHEGWGLVLGASVYYLGWALAWERFIPGCGRSALSFAGPLCGGPSVAVGLGLAVVGVSAYLIERDRTPSGPSGTKEAAVSAPL